MMKKIAKPDIHFYFTSSSDSFLKNRSFLRDFIAFLFKKEQKKLNSLNFIFCDDAYLLAINKRYLKHDFYTDIITFDLSTTNYTEGEIYISIDRIKENTTQFGTTFQQELHRVIFHGALHLCGYKDKSKADKAIMTAKENTYLTAFFAK